MESAKPEPGPGELQVLAVTDRGVDTEHLKACRIDAPTAGSHMDPNALRVVGWVLGESSPAKEVEVASGRTVVARAPVEISRPGVEELFPGFPGADAAGFDVTLAAHGRGNSELQVNAVLEDGTRAAIGTIQVNIPRQPGLLSRFFQ